MSKHDFSVDDHGSIFIVTPHSDAAQEWWTENVPEAQSFGLGYVVEHRYIKDLSHGILENGLTITKDDKTMQVSDTGELILI
jgi:sugar lactone lactonase YvrE